jgi:hypothetical protein
MRWLWKGIFSLEVPEGWHVVETGDLIEITPPQPVGAAHISVLRRGRNGPIAYGEASELVSNFAHKQGGEAADLSEEAEESHWTARAEFETTDQTGELRWDVEAHVWDERALVCSFCHDGLNEGIRRAALEMFRSIAPSMATEGPSVH